MSTAHNASSSLFRERSAHGHHRVTFVELFFDLVFVFAVTQLSHSLLAHFTALGLVQVLVLMAAVWWVWIYTCWITNWLDPERPSVRLMMFALMLAGLALSTSIPEAFGERGWVFAVAYTAMQLGRTLFMLRAIPPGDVALRRNFQRIGIWLCVSATLWIAGGLSAPPQRLLLWGGALLVEYAGPALRFWSPGLGASKVEDWAVEGGHLSERAALFIIIALGESILVTGATFAEAHWDGITAAAFAVAFVGSLAMWWIYFDTGAEFGSQQISHARDPGRLGRLAYTYLHLPLVAGVILSAVGDELSLAHPHAATDVEALLGVVGGPILYLLGALLFKHAIRGWFQLSHLVGIAALGALCAFGSLLSRLGLATTTAAVLALVAAWESLSLRSAPKPTGAPGDSPQPSAP
ncbi:MAG TPA: low temperature requirement protein A [Polyangiaceae bacterium]|nr:low temperature requirement protein A [Polyangiaceae bacterium]